MSWTNTRAKIAHTKRVNPDADVTDLQRQLKAERLADHVQKTVADWPPLSAEQRDAIAVLLRTPSGGAAA